MRTPTQAEPNDMTMCSPARASAASSLPQRLPSAHLSQGTGLRLAVYSPLSDVSPVALRRFPRDRHAAHGSDADVQRDLLRDELCHQPSIHHPHPQSQTVAQGSNVTFTVTADGTAPLAYQWRFASTNIAGATTNSYTRINVAASGRGKLFGRGDKFSRKHQQLECRPDPDCASAGPDDTLVRAAPVAGPEQPGLHRAGQNQPQRDQLDYHRHASSPRATISFTNQPGATQRFYRVVYP